MYNLNVKEFAHRCIGAGSGFGRVIAELFAQNGARVALMGRDAANLEETKKRIGGKPEDVSHLSVSL